MFQSKVGFDLEKKNHEILAALQYKPLYNISHSEIWGKKYKLQLIMPRIMVVKQTLDLCHYAQLQFIVSSKYSNVKFVQEYTT